MLGRETSRRIRTRVHLSWTPVRLLPARVRVLPVYRLSRGLASRSCKRESGATRLVSHLPNTNPVSTDLCLLTKTPARYTRLVFR